MQAVYLAGPIFGLSEGEAKNWRQATAEALWQKGVDSVSPLRCEPPREGTYKQAHPEDLAFGSPMGIYTKNAMDCRTCEAVLAYLPKPPEGRNQSYGTLWEVAFAHALGKPVVIVSDDPAVTEHPLFKHSALILPTLEEAIRCLAGWFGPNRV